MLVTLNAAERKCQAPGLLKFAGQTHGLLLVPPARPFLDALIFETDRFSFALALTDLQTGVIDEDFPPMRQFPSSIRSENVNNPAALLRTLRVRSTPNARVDHVRHGIASVPSPFYSL